MRQKIKKVICFANLSIVLTLILFPLDMTQARKGKLGKVCYDTVTNGDCDLGDCETSQKLDANGRRIAYCDCDDIDTSVMNIEWTTNESESCADEFGPPYDGGIWKCKNGAESTYDVDYCVSTGGISVEFAVEPNDRKTAAQTALDAILDIDAASKITVTNLTDDINDKLSIKIPGLDFSKMNKQVDSEGYLYIPWIGEYIAAIYKYALVAASILAVVMIIIQGARIVVSGGGENQTAGYKRIGQIVVGLFILWGSYAIMYNINPDLVSFKALRVKFVEPINLETVVNTGHTPLVIAGKSKQFSASDYDDIFKKFASCAGIDWRLLKVIAFKESGLNPSIRNEFGYTGLFQTLPEYCEENLKKLGMDTALCKNPGIFDPAVNTAIGTNMLKTSLNMIKKRCNNLSARDTLFMIYFAHANGAGGFCAAQKKYGCSVNTWKDETWGSADMPYIKPCVRNTNDLMNKKIFLGAPYNYAYATADLATTNGINTVYTTTDGAECPTKTKILPKSGAAREPPPLICDVITAMCEEDTGETE